MFPMNLPLWAAVLGTSLMPHVLQASAATGGLSAAVVSTVLSALQSPLPPVTCQDLLPSTTAVELHWPSVLLGLVLGVLLGQVLESLVLARHYLGWQLRQRLWSWNNSRLGVHESAGGLADRDSEPSH